MNKTLRHSYIYIIGSLLQALVPFLLIPILTRNSTQSEFGFVMLLISIGTVLSFGFSLGIPAVLSRELIFQEDSSLHLKKVSASYQTLLLLLAIIIYLLTLFINVATPSKILLLGVVLALCLAGIQIKLSVLRAEFKSVLFASLAIASTAVPLLAITIQPNFLKVDLYQTYTSVAMMILLVSNFRNLFNALDVNFFHESKN